MENLESQFNNCAASPDQTSDSVRGRSDSLNDVSSSRSTPRSKQRYTIDFTAGAASEVKRIKEMFSLTTTDLFRFALSLMRVYADAVLHEKEVHVVDPKDPRVAKIVELPLFRNTKSKGGGH